MRPWRIALGAFVACGLADRPPVSDFVNFQAGQYGDPPSQRYRSSNIVSPIFNYNTWQKKLIAGSDASHLFLSLDYSGSGPYIFRDDDLSLAYADPSFDYAMNARAQFVNQEQYLTFWHGARNQGDSQGFCVFYNNRYELKYNVTLQELFTIDADMHECEATASGSVLLTAYQDKRFDLTPLGGKVDGMLADGCFQDVEIETNEALFSWCASDHFDLGLAYWNLTGVDNKKKRAFERASSNDSPSTSYTTSSGFDAYHINSLQKVRMLSLNPLDGQLN